MNYDLLNGNITAIILTVIFFVICLVTRARKAWHRWTPMAIAGSLSFVFSAMILTSFPSWSYALGLAENLDTAAKKGDAVAGVFAGCGLVLLAASIALQAWELSESRREMEDTKRVHEQAIVVEKKKLQQAEREHRSMNWPRLRITDVMKYDLVLEKSDVNTWESDKTSPSLIQMTSRRKVNKLKVSRGFQVKPLAAFKITGFDDKQAIFIDLGFSRIEVEREHESTRSSSASPLPVQFSARTYPEEPGTRDVPLAARLSTISASTLNLTITAIISTRAHERLCYSWGARINIKMADLPPEPESAQIIRAEAQFDEIPNILEEDELSSSPNRFVRRFSNGQEAYDRKAFSVEHGQDQFVEES